MKSDNPQQQLFQRIPAPRRLRIGEEPTPDDNGNSLEYDVGLAAQDAEIDLQERRPDRANVAYREIKDRLRR